MTESNEITEAVLSSLKEQPTLNTPSLIATGGLIPEDVEKSEIEGALDTLVKAGRVVHRPTGWRLARETG